ncbi:MAG: hypothetical protein D6761_04060 [Candidatus Dadabacteria bacterium]|nr:MAG: hypothetical protein D6761_04060 [Candidatus Dadabacteria bacterium]
MPVMKDKIICLAVAVVLSGCASTAKSTGTLYFPQAFNEMRTVLVVPFENLTPFPEAGLIVADLLAEELRVWEGYDIRDRHAVDQIARTGGQPLPINWNRAEALRFARLLNADAVVYGTLIEFGYLREHRGLTEMATFGAVVRVADARSGRILWEATLNGSGGGTLTAGRPPLMDVSSAAIQEGLEDLFGTLFAWREAGG